MAKTFTMKNEQKINNFRVNLTLRMFKSWFGSGNYFKPQEMHIREKMIKVKVIVSTKQKV